MKPQGWVIFTFWLFGSIAVSAGLWFWGSREMVDPIDFDFLMPSNIYSEANLAIQSFDYETFSSQSKTLAGTFRNAPLRVAYDAYGLISSFDGMLKVFANGEMIYESQSPRSVAHSGMGYFHIPVGDGGMFPQLTFELSGTASRFLRVSDLYIGSRDQIFSINSRIQFTKQILTFSAFGIILAIFVASCALFLSGAISGSTAIPLVVISGFILIPSFAAFASIKTSYILTSLPISGMPILVVNIWHLRRNILSDTLPAPQWNLQIAGLILTASLLLCAFMTETDLRFLGMYFAGPVLFLSLWSFVLKGVLDLVKRPSVTAMLFGIAITTFAATVTHDLGMRFGYWLEDRFLAGLGAIVFAFVAGISFVRGAFELSQRLAMTNLVLEKALAAKTAELVEAFDIKAALLRENARAAEKSRMRQELHDGVLSYLSIINVLTESARVGKLAKINKSSRMAMNEIRLIIDTEETTETSLLMAISNLRRQFVDRLTELDIHVDIDVVALLELKDLPYKIVVETIRILQEAIHNAAFRGNCKHLSIVGDLSDIAGNDEATGFTIRVSNTGGRPLRERQLAGNGMRNMRMRATRIGASLAISCLDDGAIVQLTWPGSATGEGEAVQWPQTVQAPTEFQGQGHANDTNEGRGDALFVR
jgi:signal transduction histidine kinase